MQLIEAHSREVGGNNRRFTNDLSVDSGFGIRGYEYRMTEYTAKQNPCLFSQFQQDLIDKDPVFPPGLGCHSGFSKGLMASVSGILPAPVQSPAEIFRLGSSAGSVSGIFISRISDDNNGCHPLESHTFSPFGKKIQLAGADSAPTTTSCRGSSFPVLS